MKSLNIDQFLIGILLICFVSMGYSQETPDANMEKSLYKEYKANGIEKAMKMYDQSEVKGNEYSFQKEPLNQLGYHIMQEDKDLKAAEKVFLAQIDEYPEEANPYDSYADLLMEKGEKEKAKQNYQKAIELAANIQDESLKQQMINASKPKLAQLDGSGNKLDFLQGTWNTKNYNIQNGNKTLAYEGSVTFKKEGSMLEGTMHNKEGKYGGTRIIAYNAVDGVYDMAFINSALAGIAPSTLKIENSTPEKVVMIEKYNENGKDITVKHVLNRKGNEIAWDVVDLTDGGDNKVAEMVFNKN